MGLPAAGLGDDGIMFGGGGDVHTNPPKYRHPVYRNSSDTRYMSRGGSIAGSAGERAVVDLGRNRHQTVGGTDRGVGGGGGEGGLNRYGGSGEVGNDKVGV